MPPFSPPYENPIEKEIIISAYRTVFDRVSLENAKFLYLKREKESLFYWANGVSQLCLVLEPFVNAEDASEIKTKVLDWLRDQDHLFMKEDFLFK